MKKSALILLHGSGGSGEELIEYFQMVHYSCFNGQTFLEYILQTKSIDFYTPSSDCRHYSAKNIYRNVWFDRSKNFLEKGLDDTEDTTGIDQSFAKIMKLLYQLDTDYHYDSIFLGGHSMGGAVALHALRYSLPLKLKGIFSIGSFLVNSSAVLSSELTSNTKLPVFMMHGEIDESIPIEWGLSTAMKLANLNIPIRFRTYPNVDHYFGEYQLLDLIRWILRIRHRDKPDDAQSILSSHLVSEGDDQFAEKDKDISNYPLQIIPFGFNTIIEYIEKNDVSYVVTDFPYFNCQLKSREINLKT